ncbi:hypothetical protein ACH4ZU_00765 [Streptomyces sp. NPDC020472]|uniref:hypothetical protein n=1 Tax=Streptomyces sp. NPDC020472 TaxID=3365075 RepID=UPI0037B28DB5
MVEELITTALEHSGPPTPRGAADAVIDLMRDCFRTHRACVELWFAGRGEIVGELVRDFDAVRGGCLRPP